MLKAVLIAPFFVWGFSSSQEIYYTYCRPLAASQVTGRKNMEVTHKFTQPYITFLRIFYCLLDPPKTCNFAGSIKLCCMLTGLFRGTGLFDKFYYIFTGESISKAVKFDNLCSMKILNMPLTKKSPARPGIRTKRPEQKQTLQTKKGAISRPWWMSATGVRKMDYGIFRLGPTLRRVFKLFLMCVSGPAIGVRGCAFPDPAGLAPTGPEFKFGGGGKEVIGGIQ